MQTARLSNQPANQPANQSACASTPARPLSPGEEVANTLSHGIGLVAALIGTPYLVGTALAHKNSLALVSACVFAGSALLLYLASTLYHGCQGQERKRVLQKLDHAAIYLLIAGTYTPFALGPLHGPIGWAILGVVWALALLGISLTVFCKNRKKVLSLFLYLGMGWLIVAAIGPLCRAVPKHCLHWLVAGGLAYTGGVVFYLSKGTRYMHLLWHACVLAGTVCHYFAVLWYAC